MPENIDRRDGEVYVFAHDDHEGDDPLRLAIKVALATGKPRKVSWYSSILTK